jgi:hypothetical protein
VQQRQTKRLRANIMYCWDATDASYYVFYVKTKQIALRGHFQIHISLQALNRQRITSACFNRLLRGWGSVLFRFTSIFYPTHTIVKSDYAYENWVNEKMERINASRYLRATVSVCNSYTKKFCWRACESNKRRSLYALNIRLSRSER